MASVQTPFPRACQCGGLNKRDLEGMVKTNVTSTTRTTATAGDVWSWAQQFTSPWHPAVDWMQGEVGQGGAMLRRFGVAGETVEYLEQRSYLSHSDRVFSYSALSGIEEATSYTGRFEVIDSGDGSILTWAAEIEADPPRLDTIADGTKAVFDAGLAFLSTQDRAASIVMPELPSPTMVQERKLIHDPRLAISIAPAGLKQAEILCIYLHGIGGQRSNWRPQLAAHGSVVPSVTLDLRGYGGSSLGPEQTRVDDYCNDILALATEFGARKVILVGLSYGSWIATSFAMRHPEMLAGLVLGGGCTGMSEATPKARDNFRNSREIPLNLGQTPADFAADVVRIIAGPNANAQIRTTLTQSMAAIPVATYRDALNCFTNPPEVFDFTRINCPVLLMTGEHDVLAPPSEIRAVSQRMFDTILHPDIQFEEISGAGHLCNLESPEQFNQYLLPFLQRVTKNMSKPVLSSKEARRRAKHDRILDAALAEFAKHGFSGASMRAIATRAGVSKPTLYQYFGHKQALLTAVLEVGKTELLAPLADTENRPMVTVLWEFSWVYAGFVLRPDMLSLARLIIGEAENLPDIARDYQTNGPRKALVGTIAFLLHQKQRGAIQFEDAELAAQNLWSLILSTPREHYLHHPADSPSHTTIARYIVNGLGVFLRAYSTDPQRHTADLSRIAAQKITSERQTYE